MKKALSYAVSAAVIMGCTFSMNVFSSAQTTDSRIYGDVNGDGLITAADALLALQVSVDKIELNSEQITAADVSGDSELTAADALYILQYSVQKITSFPAGTGVIIIQPIETDDPESEYAVTGSIDLSALASGETYTVTEAGVYLVTGTAANASVCVDAGTSDVVLLLKGANLTGGFDTPTINCLTAGSLTIAVTGDSESTVTDSAANTTAAAAIYSAASLNFRGNAGATLNITGLSGAGILVEGSTLKITSGTILVNAADNGIQTKKKGSDFIISGGSTTVTAKSDGLKSSKTGITISGGWLDITAGQDGIQAETVLNISTSGKIKITTAGGHTATENWVYEEDESGNYVLINDSYIEIDEEDTAYSSYTKYDTVSCKGLKATESLSISNGIIVLDCLDDGINCDGTVNISGGVFGIATSCDGIQGDTLLDISGGSITVNTAGQYVVSSTDGDYVYNSSTGTYSKTASDMSGGKTLYSLKNSCKGLKSDTAINISGGNFTINTADDAVHSNGNIMITGGSFNISTGDDGIHADSTAIIGSDSASAFTEGFIIEINNCYEGIEGNYIEIYDAEITINSSDDGINAAGGADSQTTAADYYIHFGGFCKVVVYAAGDGIDANGNVTMTGGTVVVFGPTDNGNGAIDYDGNFYISGGTLAAFGSSGMAQVPDNPSQYVLAAVPSSLSSFTSGSLVNISGGSIDFTVKLPKSYTGSFSVVFSSPAVNSGGVYTLSSGGTYTGGTTENNICINGTYAGGNAFATLTVSNYITTYGQIGIGGTPGGGQTGGNTGGEGNLPPTGPGGRN